MRRGDVKPLEPGLHHFSKVVVVCWLGEYVAKQVRTRGFTVRSWPYQVMVPSA